MIGTAFITGADRGLGLALAANLLGQNWRVFAGQYLPDWPELGTLTAQYPETLTVVPLDVSAQESVEEAARIVAQRTDQIDLLINNAGINAVHREQTIRQPQDYDEIQQLYAINSLGPLRVVAAFLPLTDPSPMKRLCFVSSEAGSIGRARRSTWFGYCMSKAALNMGVRLLFNDLRPQGYTFRLYHPGWMRSYIGGSGVKGTRAPLEPEVAASPALDHFLSEHANPTAEDQLELQDHQGRAWPW
ncbi:MAG: SDR family NAD(P)-dependent oxidoreductase [Candidatus Latescibacteria bacterium]|nr:SDR family NAD(P)-dependent oxidoreductase [Candidatus Latescibacterota bacterium]